jgi:hypothetical protein
MRLAVVSAEKASFVGPGCLGLTTIAMHLRRTPIEVVVS